jgi:hypothetical protein
VAPDQERQHHTGWRGITDTQNVLVEM